MTKKVARESPRWGVSRSIIHHKRIRSQTLPPKLY
jgi:hypothetical protein